MKALRCLICVGTLLVAATPALADDASPSIDPSIAAAAPASAAVDAAPVATETTPPPPAAPDPAAPPVPAPTEPAGTTVPAPVCPEVSATSRWRVTAKYDGVPVYRAATGRRVRTNLWRTTGWSPNRWWLRVLNAREDAGRCSLQLRLGDRPNHLTGWVDTRMVKMQRTPWAIVVSRGEKTVTVLKNGESVLSGPVLVGGARTPTPRGEFAIMDVFKGTGRWGHLGPWVLVTTAHSNVYTEFGGRRRSCRPPRAGRSQHSRHRDVEWLHPPATARSQQDRPHGRPAQPARRRYHRPIAPVRFEAQTSTRARLRTAGRGRAAHRRRRPGEARARPSRGSTTSRAFRFGPRPG